MADTRKARRDAEKAAKETLGTTLVDAAGDLGAAHAEQQAAAEVVQAAKNKADEIRRAAETEAAAVIADAAQQVTTANTTYAAAWNAAKTAGWTPAQLRTMGYTKPPTQRRASEPEPQVTEPATTTSPAESDRPVGDQPSPAAVA